MARPKFAFLPAFFITLGVLFCIALWLRIRTYRDAAPADQSRAQTSAAKAGTQAAGMRPSAPFTAAPIATTTPPVAENAPRRTRRAAPVPFVPPPPPAAASAGMTAAKPRPAPATPAKPSLFSRIVTPIVNAISGNSSGSSSSSGPQTSSGRTPSTGTSGTSGTSSTADPNDPNSDTQPPQIVSIAFNPPAIHDGEETVLTIDATDNLSGVRSISGTIAAPSGAVQGFACQRVADTELYTARVAVPKDAAEGTWRINYLTLIDNASNAATLSSQAMMPPGSTFKVISSSSDTTGPKLKAIWLDRLAMREGEKDTVFIDAQDDNSGVNLISGVFVSPSKHARIGFVCRPGDGTTWSGDLSTPSCLDCGDWQLEQVQLQDKANNMTTVRSDNPLVSNVRVNITGDKCDSTPPEVTSLVLDRNAVSNAQDSIVNATAVASDDMCGIMSMSGQVTGPATAGGTPRLYFSFTSGGDGTTWTGRIIVPKLAAKGMWRVSWIQVLDQAHNLKTYSQGDPALANAAFNVQ